MEESKRMKSFKEKGLIGCLNNTPSKKYVFDIHYQTKHMREANEFLIKCDIWIKETFLCFKEKVSFNYTGQDKPISYFKDLLIQAFESQDMKIVSIEGGIVE